MGRDDLLEETLLEYSRAVVLSDPARLEAWEELGLTMSQLRVLFFLNTDPGMAAGALADRLRVRPSTATGIVDRLVRQELVLRETDQDDRRVVRNYLTERGAKVVNEFRQANRAFLLTILDKLPDQELTQLHDALTVLTRRAEEMGLLAPPYQGQPVVEMR